MSLKEIFDALSTGGVIGICALLIYGFLTSRIVPRDRLDEMRADKKEALELARSAIADNERLAAAVEARNRLEEARELAERERRDR